MRTISLVLCTFNGGRFLDEQLRSLRQQEGVMEIVVVDDHSTDDTMALLQQHAAEDARVRVYWNEKRLGVVANFERAIGFARGEWIALSDQDDIWVPDKIARLRAAWDGRSCLIHHATRKFRGTPPRRLPPRAGESRKFSGRDTRALLYRNSIVGHTTLLRADVARSLRPFPPEVPHDWWLGVGATLSGKVQYLDEFLVHYRIHETNAYHCAGSRVRRLREEHELRVNLLDALIARRETETALRDFSEEYREALVTAEGARVSLSLARFYWRHAALFFGGGGAPLSPLRRARKTLAAACGAVAQNRGPAPRPLDEAEDPAATGLLANLAVAAVLSLVLALSAVAWGSRAAPVRSTVIEVAPTMVSAVRHAPAPERDLRPEVVPAYLQRSDGRPAGGFPPFRARFGEGRRLAGGPPPGFGPRERGSIYVMKNFPAGWPPRLRKAPPPRPGLRLPLLFALLRHRDSGLPGAEHESGPRFPPLLAWMGGPRPIGNEPRFF